MMWISYTTHAFPPSSLPPTPRIDRTCIPCIGRWFLYHWATREDPRSFLKFVDSNDSEAAWVGKDFFSQAVWPSSLTKDWTQILCSKYKSPNHWTARKVLAKDLWSVIGVTLFQLLESSSKGLFTWKRSINYAIYSFTQRYTVKHLIMEGKKEKEKEWTWDNCQFQNGLATATP